jgi:hypothetical protein
MLPFLASLFGMAIPGMTAAGTAAAGTAGTAAAGTAGAGLPTGHMMPGDAAGGSPMSSMFGGQGGGGGSGGGGGQDEAEAMKLATGAMGTAAAGAKGGSPLIGMRYGPQNYGPQQQFDIRQLMAVLNNRSRLG